MATCYDKGAIVSRAAVLHAVIAWTCSFIRHACKSPNETGEGVQVSWWLASLLCFLLFAPPRRVRSYRSPSDGFSLANFRTTVPKDLPEHF